MISNEERYNAVRSGLVAAARALFAEEIIEIFEKEIDKSMEYMNFSELSEFYDRIGINIQNAVRKSGLTIKEMYSMDQKFPLEKVSKISYTPKIERKITPILRQ